MNAFRSKTDRRLAGVCGGLAAELGWSSFRVRLIWVLTTIFTGFAGALVYLALWFLMPPAPLDYEPAILQPWKRPA